jgi:cytochrome P450
MTCIHFDFSWVVLATAGILTRLFLFNLADFIPSHSLPLPPGPKGHWFFGIKKQLPRKEPWKVYASWAQSYSGNQVFFLSCCSIADKKPEPVISFPIYNRTVIIANDLQSISDLLERRAGNTSDRPEQYMSHQVCGRSKTVFNITSRDPRFKVYRKLLQQGLGLRSTKTYWPTLQEELETLLNGLAESPQQYVQHVRR